MLTLITNARIITETTTIPNGWLLVTHDKITQLGDDTPPHHANAHIINANGGTLLPGFIDIHVHGGGGDEVMDATPQALQTLSHFYAKHGVTSFLATTWTADGDAIHRALQTVASTSVDGAQMLGAHVEGPYISEKRAGAQSPHLIRRADKGEFAQWQATGVIRLMTIAPEYPENQALIAHCIAQGIIISAGHTDATLADMRGAVAMGVSNTTHTFNAMRPLHHREAGTVGAALLMPQLRCEIICDGVHVQPDVVRLLYQTKGADHTILITDAVRGAGMADGATYLQDGRTVTVRDGAVYLDDGTLAGSTLTMEMAFRNFMTYTGAPIDEIWRCASLTPARALRIDHQTGSIAVGKRADMVLLDDALQVRLTMVGGRVVYHDII